MNKRLVVGLSGASGAPLSLALLEGLRFFPEWEVHLVISRAGERVLREETGKTPEDLRPLVHTVHDLDNIGASIASGTFATQGMVVLPCSMKTLAGICHGYADNLLLRAADVTLKERRKLVLVARETPLSLIHLRNMASLAEMGVVIMPPVLTYYNQPQSIEDMAGHLIGKVMLEFGLEFKGFRRWPGSKDLG
ncbi:MAG: UbiX family flavin prenyltransferase [Candidatus Adiutrix sp.]|nr:UbiX family flavin prenyltransferase [Candidatus Adiutrix sp.]